MLDSLYEFISSIYYLRPNPLSKYLDDRIRHGWRTNETATKRITNKTKKNYTRNLYTTLSRVYLSIRQNQDNRWIVDR